MDRGANGTDIICCACLSAISNRPCTCVRHPQQHKMLRGLIGLRQLAPLVDKLQLAPTSNNYLQQYRGAKAQAKKKNTAQKGKQLKGKQQGAKKQKQKLETKPFDEKNPLNQKVIAMLIPPAAEPVQRTHQVQAEMVQRAKEFSRQQMKAHLDWMTDMKVKLQLKNAALQALPPGLRAAAKQEDLRPFPLTRHYLYDSPPEAYRD